MISRLRRRRGEGHTKITGFRDLSRKLRALCPCVSFMLNRTKRETVTKTVTSLEKSGFCTAGSLENSGVGEGNQTLVVSLGS